MRSTSLNHRARDWRSNPNRSDTFCRIAGSRPSSRSQAIYDTDSLARFLDAAKLGEFPLLAGVIPLKSAKMGVWLNANVPGVHVPSALLEELERAGPEDEAAKGVEIAARTIRRLRDICRGVHLMAIGWELQIPESLGAAGVSSA